ncbi:MAG: DUF4383 domain-containing protein [Verrucomicrobiota bacterium]
MTRRIAQVFGLGFILIGILGFVPGITEDEHLFGIFHVDAVHNFVHLLTGVVALIAGSVSFQSARVFFQVFGIIYGLVAILGFINQANPVLGFLSNNIPDAWLHTVIALLALYFGFGPVRETTPASPEVPPS